jgi:hypothetical protein
MQRFRDRASQRLAETAYFFEITAIVEIDAGSYKPLRQFCIPARAVLCIENIS